MLFMTRKRLEEEKAKAVREHEERMWLDERFNRMENSIYREINDLRKKVHELEKANGKHKCESYDGPCVCGNAPVEPLEVAIHE